MTKSTIAIAAIVLAGTAAFAETTEKAGKTATGETCKVMVEKHPDGRVTALGASSGSTTGSTASSGSISSSSSAGGSSVHVQAGGGSVSSSSTSGGPGSTSASTVTVNGCTISTSSP